MYDFLFIFVIFITTFGQAARKLKENEADYMSENGIVEKSLWKKAVEDVLVEVKQSLYKDSQKMQKDHENNLSNSGIQQQDQIIQNITALFNNFSSKKDKYFLDQHNQEDVSPNDESSLKRISNIPEEGPELMTITHIVTVNNETKEGLAVFTTSVPGHLLKNMLGEVFLSEDLPPAMFFLIVSVIAVPVLMTVFPVVFVLGFVPLIFLAIIVIMLGMGMTFFMPFISAALEVFSWFFNDSDAVTQAVSTEDIIYHLNETTIDIEDVTTSVTEFFTNVPRYFN